MRFLRWKLAVVLMLFGFGAGSVFAQNNADYTRTEDVLYGRKFGMALTMDVFQPKETNGLGIIFVVSGGWFSSHDSINPAVCQQLTKRGYTVFAVVHGSQPKFTITEAMQDMHRAVRFIRHNAMKYGIDPNKLGVIGGSAGGHLSLILGTQTASSDRPKNKDAIDEESSAVQCVACFFPPTDFLNYGGAGIDGVGFGVLQGYKMAFGPMSGTEEGRLKLGKEISPIYNVTSNLPPTLIIHGDADKLVPIQQSESFVKRAKQASAEAKLIVKEGKEHGWPGWLEQDMTTCIDWFDEHLRGTKPTAK